MLAEGQVEGALQQGIGFTLSEQILYQDGQPLNPNFGDYKIPTASEMPRLEIAWVQDSEPTGPFGAKGLGEHPAKDGRGAALRWGINPDMAIPAEAARA